MDKTREILANISQNSGNVAGGVYRTLNKFILISLVIFLLAWWQFENIAGFLINPDNLKQDITQYLSEKTGKRVEIKGELKFVTNPKPEVLIKKVFFYNHDGSQQKIFSKVEELRINPKLLQLVFGGVNFGSIYLENLLVNFEKSRAEDNKTIIANFLDNNEEFLGKDIKIKNVQLNFFRKNLKSDSYYKNSLNFSDLEYDYNAENADGDIIKGAFYDKTSSEDLIFLLDFDNGVSESGSLKGRIYSDKTELEIKGNVDLQNLNTDFKIFGKVGDFSQKFFIQMGFADELVNAIKKDENTSFSASIKLLNSQLEISDIYAKSNYIDLNGSITSTFSERIKHKLNVKISKFDFQNALSEEVQGNDGRTVTTLRKDFQQRLDEFVLFAVADDTDFEVDFRIAEIRYKEGETGFFNIKASYLNSDLIIDKFVIKLPGNSGFSVASKLKVNKFNETISGNLAFKLKGKNLNKMLRGLKFVHNKGKKDKLGNFTLAGKAYFYGKQVHFREINGRVDDNLLAGQFLIDYSKKFKAQSAFNFNKLELDKFIIKKSESEVYEDNSFAARLDVIRYLDSIFDELTISFNSDNLTKTGEKLEDFSLFVKVTPGVTDIKNIYFKTKTTGRLKGKAYFDITDFQPKAKFDLEIDNLDFNLLVDGKRYKSKYNFDGKWSDKKISFDVLNSFDGSINIKATNFKFLHFDFKKLRVNMETANGKTKINEARIDAFGTKVDIIGDITNDFPSFNLDLIATNIQVDKFMRNTLLIPSILGKFNINGNISSTGYSFKELAKNLKGSLSVVTRGFSIRGFDINAFSKAMPKIKRIEQAEAAGKYYLNRGSTKFNGISTPVAINNGKILLNKVPLKHPLLRDSSSSGEIDIGKWEMNLYNKLTILSDDRVYVNIPLRTISKNVPQTEFKWDYKGIVKYWEDKFYNGRI